MENQVKYKRVLLKISGEALSSKGNTFDEAIISRVCEQIKQIREMGVEVGVVIGGGNIWRGRQNPKMDKSTADYMGMLATCINALALSDTLEQIEVPTRVMTAFEIEKVAEPFVKRDAIKHLEKSRVVIFAGGTGNPYFSTDSGAALRANEIGADVILLAKNIDAVYTADPKKDPTATRIEEMTFSDLISNKLGVMDLTAATLCMDNNMPILVFGLAEENSIVRAVSGENIGTYIH